MSLTYDYNSPNTGEATVKGYSTGNSYSGTLTIPDTVDYDTGSGTQTYNVTAIKEDAFYQYANLTGVTIGNNVTSIDRYAFMDCTLLATLSIGNSVTSISNGVFYNCNALQSVTIPDSVQSIGNAAFRGCDILQSVYLPNNTNFTTISNGLFRECPQLTSVIIPASVTSIGTYAFYQCGALAKVAIVQNSGNNLTIVSNAFQNTNASLVVFIKDGNQTFGGSPRTIGGTGSFFGSNASTSFKSYIVNGTGAFAASDYTTAGSPHYMELTGWSSIGDSALVSVSALQSVTIPDSVTTISSYAFAGTALQSVIIPDNVTYIGNDAFYSCSALQSVIIGDSVATIGDSVFQYCFALDSVTFKRTDTDSVIDFEMNGGDVFGSVTASNLILYVNSIILDSNTITVGQQNATLQGGTFANVSLSSNVCFPPGTVLSLDQGDVEIQNVDTKKHTLNGKPIIFVTKTAPNKPDVVCFEKDAFAPNVPSQRFECSRAHGIEFDGVRKMAEDWVDADQIHFVPNTHKFLYCLLLETHEMMDVYNIKAETLNPVRKVAQMYFAQLRKEKESC